jgi:hypothetical protein
MLGKEDQSRKALLLLPEGFSAGRHRTPATGYGKLIVWYVIHVTRQLLIPKLLSQL